MPAAVVFDVDGTLVDSNDLHVAAWQEAFRKFGKDVPFETIRQQVGKGGDQLVPLFFSKEELERFGHELLAYRSDLYVRKYMPRVKPFPCARELLKRVHDDGKKVALATSSREQEVCALRKLIGGDEFLDAVTSADDVERSKPYPDIFAVALDKLAVDAADAIAVGDTPYDAQAAGKLGLSIVGVLCGGFSERELREAGCCAIFRDPADLLQHYDKSPLAGKPARVA